MKHFIEGNADKLNGMYRAKVLDNVDPKNQGRIKLEVFPTFLKLVADDVPWAVPAMGLGFGGAGSGFGSFTVPDVDSFVWCFFEAGEMHQPVYFASAPDGAHGLPASIGDPKKRLWRTETGIEMKVDDAASVIRVDHPSGTFVEIKADGTVDVSAVENVNVISAKDITETAEGDITETATKNILEEATISIKTDANITNQMQGKVVADVTSFGYSVIRGAELAIGAPTDTVPEGSTSDVRRVWVVTSATPLALVLSERRLSLAVPPGALSVVVPLV